jgi:hypothetical protein
VTGSELVGRITDAAGLPVPGARVVFDTDETWGLESTFTDGDGRYHLRPLPPGEFDVTVSRAGFLDTCAWVEIAENASTTFDAVLEPGSPVRGSLVDAAGRPVPGAAVWAEAINEQGEADDSVRILADHGEEIVYQRVFVDDFDDADDSGDVDEAEPTEPLTTAVLCSPPEAVTDANGGFVLASVPAGDYAVLVDRAGDEVELDSVHLPGADLVLILPQEDAAEATIDDAPVSTDLESEDEKTVGLEAMVAAALHSSEATDDSEDAYTENFDGDDDLAAEIAEFTADEGWADVRIWGEPEAEPRLDL